MEDEDQVQLEEIIISFDGICRICMIKPDNLVSLFDVESGELYKKLEIISSLTAREDDGYPPHVCDICSENINIVYDFIIQCQQSDIILRNCYQETLQKAKDEYRLHLEEIKAKVREDELENNVVDVNGLENTNELDSTDIPVTVKYSHLAMYNCNICKFTVFTKKTSLIQHLVEEHCIRAEDLTDNVINERFLTIKNSTEDAKQKYFCSECPRKKTFVRKFTFRRHMQNKHKEVSVDDYYFSQHFINDQLLPIGKLESGAIDQHEQLGEGAEVESLQIGLKKELTLKKRLRKAKLRLAEDMEQFKELDNKQSDVFCCEECKDVFRDKNILALHVSEKHGAETLKCSLCKNGKSFISREVILKHFEYVHRVQKPEIIQKLGETLEKEGGGGCDLLPGLVCGLCEVKHPFNLDEEFIDHLVSVHRIVNPIKTRQYEEKYVAQVRNSLDLVVEKEVAVKEKVKLFVCKVCDTKVVFTSAKDLDEHNKSVHEPPKSEDLYFRCTEEGCGTLYKSKWNLKVHYKTKHDKVVSMGKYCCPIEGCSARFTANRKLLMHGVAEHGSYLVNSDVIFKKKILLAPSKKQVKQFRCDVCYKKYFNKSGLKTHILKFHVGQDAEKQTVVICSYCGKTYRNKKNLTEHISLIHEKTYVNCPVCEKRINLNNLPAHYKIHNSTILANQGLCTNGFVCNVCGKVLKSKRTLKTHVKLHRPNKNEECEMCKKKFVSVEALHNHWRVHSGLKYKCVQCEKVFKGKHTLSRHVLTHTGVKDYICEMCCKGFYTISELKRHIKFHQKVVRYNCDICEKKFLEKSTLRIHIMAHKKIRLYDCEFCKKKFPLRYKLSMHIQTKHQKELQATAPVETNFIKSYYLDELLTMIVY